MARVIEVETDKLYVGYNYIDSYYYVSNQKTTTARLTAKEAYDIIVIIHPESASSEFYNQVVALSTEIEYLHNIYYALEDSGLGIKALWFNSYKDYALIYDGNILYINNSDNIYTISSYSIPAKIIASIKNFFFKKIGLDISESDLMIIYNYLITTSFNKPVYNNIASTKGEDNRYYYSNTLSTLNSSKVLYTAEYNPDNIYTYNTLIGEIDKIDLNTSQIYLPTNNLIINIGDYIKLDGCNINLDNSNYSNDGIYQITNLSTDTELNQIATVDRPFKFNYNPIAYIQSMETVINKITLSNTYSCTNLITGTKIKVENSPSNDGVYTVLNCITNTDLRSEITVAEDIPQNYERPVSGTMANITLNSLPKLYLGSKGSSILLNVISSFIPNKFPIGEFILDNTSQLTEYLELANLTTNLIPIPTEENYNNLYAPIPLTTEIDGLSQPLTFVGLYSELFLNK